MTLRVRVELVSVGGVSFSMTASMRKRTSGAACDSLVDSSTALRSRLAACSYSLA